MPNFDRTGPNGLGEMTGRKAGPCANGESQGMGRGRGCFRGCGGGQGRGQGGFGFGNVGRGANFYQPVSLEEREKMLEQELASVREAKEKTEKKD